MAMRETPARMAGLIATGQRPAGRRGQMYTDSGAAITTWNQARSSGPLAHEGTPITAIQAGDTGGQHHMTQERTGARTAVTTPATASGSTTPIRTSGSSGVGGVTKIADSVVARIAGLAAREVPGVHEMTGSGLQQAFGGLTGRVTGQDQMDRGVAVQVGEVECIVNLNLVVDYEASIPQVAEAIRRNVSGRIGAMTGLQTKEVNINVADLYFPDEDQPQPPQPPPQPAVR